MTLYECTGYPTGKFSYEYAEKVRMSHYYIVAL